MTLLRNLCCPIDGELLQHHEKQLVCSNGHSFDIARQGYVNLLPVQHKRSKEPGDSKEMVVARTAFLNLGLYQPLANKLSDVINRHLESSTQHNVTILDAGCGEGYYFDFIANSLNKTQANKNFNYIGLDISKHAIIAAAKRNKQITWVVGTNRKPPVTNACVDIILCVFGFQSFEGFNKILNKDGVIILVEPGPDHLKELREIIYDDVKKTDPPNISEAQALGFSVITTEHLQFKTGDISNDTIQSLLLMTPHFFRANKAGREAATKLQRVDLTVDVVLRILKKESA